MPEDGEIVGGRLDADLIVPEATRERGGFARTAGVGALNLEGVAAAAQLDREIFNRPIGDRPWCYSQARDAVAGEGACVGGGISGFIHHHRVALAAVAALKGEQGSDGVQIAADVCTRGGVAADIEAIGSRTTLNGDGSGDGPDVELIGASTSIDADLLYRGTGALDREGVVAAAEVEVHLGEGGEADLFAVKNAGGHAESTQNSGSAKVGASNPAEVVCAVAGLVDRQRVAWLSATMDAQVGLDACQRTIAVAS